MSLPTLIRNLTRPKTPIVGVAKSRFYNKRWVQVLGLSVGTSCILYETNENFHNTVRHGYISFKRIGVVTIALSRCVIQYKKVLSLNDTIDDEDQKDENLRQCHLKA